MLTIKRRSLLVAGSIGLMLSLASCTYYLQTIKKTLFNTEVEVNPSPIIVQNDSITFELKIKAITARKFRRYHQEYILILVSGEQQVALDTIVFRHQGKERFKEQYKEVLISKQVDQNLNGQKGGIILFSRLSNPKNDLYKEFETYYIAEVVDE